LARSAAFQHAWLLPIISAELTGVVSIIFATHYLHGVPCEPNHDWSGVHALHCGGVFGNFLWSTGSCKLCSLGLLVRFTEKRLSQHTLGLEMRLLKEQNDHIEEAVCSSIGGGQRGSW